MDNQNVAACIQRAVEETNPIPSDRVTAKARRAVEVKLYGLPQLCEKLERASGPEALTITREIDSLKRALQAVSRDPYYPLIPAKYFQGAKERTAAALCACDKATAWRNRTRLLDILALRLFGVSAWDRTRT